MAIAVLAKHAAGFTFGFLFFRQTESRGVSLLSSPVHGVLDDNTSEQRNRYG